jgi:hypothetical protein
MTDRELLELAAKAAGYGDVWSLHEYPNVTYIGPRYKGGTVRYRVWNPLTDDGDALRLACKLNINVFIYEDETSTATSGVVAKNFGSVEANTRRAIVRAAAEIGKTM